MSTDTNTAASSDELVKRLHQHVLWAVHYAYELAQGHAGDAARVLRNEVTRTLRAWNK